MGELTGKRVLITGASRGLGLHVAGRFLMEGASVARVARTFTTVTGLDSSWTDIQCDVANQADISAAISQTFEVLGGIDHLICCAGIQGPIGPIEKNDVDDWTEALLVNLVGVVSFCKAVIPTMKAQRYGKIVILSGGGATSPYPNFSAYAASKAAVVRFAETIAKELDGSGIDVNCVAPGILSTGFHEATIQAGPVLAGTQYYRAKDLKENCESMNRAVDLIQFLCSDESDGITGRLISAVWDNWHELPLQKKALAKTDRYTLRRVG